MLGDGSSSAVGEYMQTNKYRSTEERKNKTKQKEKKENERKVVEMDNPQNTSLATRVCASAHKLGLSGLR